MLLNSNDLGVMKFILWWRPSKVCLLQAHVDRNSYSIRASWALSYPTCLCRR